MDNSQVSIDPKATAFRLGVIALILVLVSVGGQLLKYRFGYDVDWFLPLFDLSLELNLPNFFSMSLMFLASLLLTVIAILQGRKNHPDMSKWLFLSLGFLCMAYDEGFQVHEDLVAVIRPLLSEGRLGIFYYAWVIPAITMVLVLGLFFLGFLIRLSTRTRLFFLIAASFYLGGCIGFELVGGYYDELYGKDNLYYNLLSSVEESLEMTGLIFFLYALLDYIAGSFKVVRFQLTI